LPGIRPDYEELVYRTGDLVAMESAGNYAYLGRRDSIVKIRGYRVELGEVEATLYRHPATREAADLSVPDDLLGNRIPRSSRRTARAASLARTS
jgi:acyl-coenzyme A synthetase/AMP-(fatty) acid ligase